MTGREYENAIAVIGMAGRFPGACSVEAFWHNLVGGVRSIRDFTDDELLAAGLPRAALAQPDLVKAGAPLTNIELFDAAFFGYTPREAELTDPQHRIFLECVWEALENAACDPEACGERAGVFAGSGPASYKFNNLFTRPALVHETGPLQLAVGNEVDALAATVAYKLNLKGPSVAVQSFCSTSLVAVHLACQSLLTYECDVAVAGGVSIAVPQGQGYTYREGGILSRDGHCRTFDAAASGSVMGNGAGVVVLKRWEDAQAAGDHVYAVVRGSAINNDGRVRVGYAAPGVEGQAGVLAEALARAGVGADTIDYIEAHGTATPLGDAVELAAMRRVYGGRSRACSIGSVKPNVGHLDRAAGVTGLIKAVLTVERGIVPPQIDFAIENAETALTQGGFQVRRVATAWGGDGRPRRAAVNSFGMGGGNAHVILEEAPAGARIGPARSPQLLIVSAKTAPALEAATDQLAQYLESADAAPLADVAYTLQVGRRGFNHRRMVVSESAAAAAAALRRRTAATREEVRRQRAIVCHVAPASAWSASSGADLLARETAYQEAVSVWTTAALAAGINGSETERGARAYGLARVLAQWGLRLSAADDDPLAAAVTACACGRATVADAVRGIVSAARVDVDPPPGAEPVVLWLGPSGGPGLSALPAMPGDEVAHLLATVGHVWLNGVSIEWTALHGGPRRRVPLPTYPFQRQRFWIEPSPGTWVWEAEGDPAARRDPGKKPNVGDWFYVPVWKQAAAPRAPQSTELADHSPWLLFVDDERGVALADRLRQHACTVIQVHPGDRFEVRSPDHVVIDPASAHDAVRLLRSIAAPRTIVHAWSLGAAVSGLACLHHVVSLAQAIDATALTSPLTLWVVTENAESVTGVEPLSPESGMLPAMATAIGQEHLNVTVRRVDVDADPRASSLVRARIVDGLLGEFAARPDELGVAWRSDRRWTRHYEALPLVTGARPVLREGGVYLIVGGVGRIGLTLGEHLARTYKARLILTGRRPIPPPDQWESCLDEPGASDAVSARLRRLLALQRGGGDVLAFSASAADETRMRQIVERGVDRFGALNGAFYLAGESDPSTFRPLGEITPTIIERHLESKLRGLTVLERVLGDAPVDFCLVFSSLSSILGGLGLGAYAAANRSIDQFVHACNRRRTAPWLAVNWDTWRFDDQASRTLGATIERFEMTPAEGCAAVEAVLAGVGRTSQIVHSTGDLEARLDEWVRMRARGRGRGRDGTDEAGHTRPDLTTPFVAARHDAEKLIAGAWQEVLGLDRVGIHDHFFELGGNSLIGTQLVSRLRRLFRLNVPITILFEAPTVAELAVAIESALIDGIERPAPSSEVV